MKGTKYFSLESISSSYNKKLMAGQDKGFDKQRQGEKMQLTLG
jgi:hypothetical protein